MDSITTRKLFIIQSVATRNRMPNWHLSFGQALALPLIVHQIFFITPIVLTANRQRLVASKYLTIYSYTYLAVHILLHLNFLGVGLNSSYKTINEIGYIWFALSVLDLTMSKCTFVINVILSQRKKHYQLEFLSKIVCLDKFLVNEFDLQIDYTKLAIGGVISIGGCFVYATLASVMTWHKLEALSVNEFWTKLGYTIPYFVDKLTGTLITNGYLVCCSIVYGRYCILRRILAEEKHRSFESILKVFSNISELGDLLNRYSSVLLFTRFAHDFILCTSTTYLLCELFLSGSMGNINWFPIVGLLYINYTRIVLATLITELTQREAIIANEFDIMLNNIQCFTERILPTET